MKKLMYATKSWKILQKDYLSRDLYTMHLQKLHDLLKQNVSGYSFEEMTIHYGFISHAAMQMSIANYMQRGTFENAECYFYLASVAKATSDNLWIANPHKQVQQGQDIQLDCILAAVISGCLSSAIDMLEKTRKTFAGVHGHPTKSRKDSQQNDQRKKRILLELDFYENLLQNRDEQAQQLISELKMVHSDTLFLQVINTFFEQDSSQFFDALVQHMKEFRKNPYAGELNYFVLFMEILYQARNCCELLDLADAPAMLLKLPKCDPMQIEKRAGIILPTLEVDKLLKLIDKSKIGPQFKPY